MQFNEVLSALPEINHVAAIELFDGDTLIARIDNKPGSAGSVRVYHALAQEFEVINAVAAAKGLILYAEHTADAIAFPGKHPNIDRLLSVEENQQWTVKLIPLEEV
ncbi:DUF2322 family protein [Undibacterium sp. Ji67W]|uniref:DUF2322 family protein n=1 Tax=Undibacterium sp. Ji67W TaxID=3413042 RepID=UPI003BEFB69D